MWTANVSPSRRAATSSRPGQAGQPHVDETLGGEADEDLAAGVPEGVVDLVEQAEVDHRDRAPRARDRVQEALAVEQAGQGVVVGVATEALGERGGLDVVAVAPDPLDQQADDGGGEHEEEQAGDDQDPERGSRRGDGRRDTSRASRHHTLSGRAATSHLRRGTTSRLRRRVAGVAHHIVVSFTLRNKSWPTDGRGIHSSGPSCTSCEPQR